MIAYFGFFNIINHHSNKLKIYTTQQFQSFRKCQKLYEEKSILGKIVIIDIINVTRQVLRLIAWHKTKPLFKVIIIDFKMISINSFRRNSKLHVRYLMLHFISKWNFLLRIHQYTREWIFFIQFKLWINS